MHEFVASPVLDQVPDGCQVLTNDPWLLWLAGFEAQLSPESDREVAIPVSMRLEELAPMVAGGDVCLVWMQTGSTVFYPPEQLAGVVSLHQVAGDDFTTVYQLSPHIPGADLDLLRRPSAVVARRGSSQLTGRLRARTTKAREYGGGTSGRQVEQRRVCCRPHGVWPAAQSARRDRAGDESSGRGGP